MKLQFKGNDVCCHVTLSPDLNQYALIIVIPLFRNGLPQVYLAIEKSGVRHLQRKTVLAVFRLQTDGVVYKKNRCMRRLLTGCLDDSSQSINYRVALADPVVYDLNAQACHVRGSKSQWLPLITVLKVGHLKCTLNITRHLQYILWVNVIFIQNLRHVRISVLFSLCMLTLYAIALDKGWMCRAGERHW